VQNLFELFRDDGRKWFRGNLHTHTTCSDGDRTPEESVQFYRDAGYDFVFLTEHGVEGGNHFLADFEALSECILALPGLELFGTIGGPGRRRQMHILALGLRSPGAWRSHWSVQATIDLIRAEEAVPGLAHPYWSGIEDNDLAELTGAAFVEVYNSTCAAISDQGVSRSHWDTLLRRGLPIHGAAVDDAHWCWDVPDYGKAWVAVKADELALEPILKALREGSFYSSTGPSFGGVSLDGEEVTVHTSPVIRVNFISGGDSGVSVHSPDGETITSARRSLSDMSEYLRIECVDAKGRYAWTNAAILHP
jgi:hypothetical protein